MGTPQGELLHVCRQVVSGGLCPDAGFELIFTKMKQGNKAVASLLQDVLCIVDAEISSEKSNSDGRKRFLDFCSRLSNKIIPEDVLHFELDSLGANEPATRSRIVKTKTRLFYKQQKFNLLREESEGYAKLITELLSVSPGPHTVTLIYRLIGQFNLDPNRVLDIILECFELCLHKRRTFLSLLTQFKAGSDDICSLLGFKFTFYQASGSTPWSLYRLAAVLCREKMIDLLSLCAFLTPKLDELVAENKRRLERDVKRAKKAETVVSAVPVEPRPTSFVDESANTNITGVSFAVVAATQEADDAKLIDPADSDDVLLRRNQKLGLTCALLEEGAWSFAKQLLDRFPEFYAVNASRRIALLIADMVETSINDFYQEKCKFSLEATNLRPCFAEIIPSLEVVGSWSELTSVVLPVLNYIGPYIAYRPTAAIKLIRLVTVFFDEKPKDGELLKSTANDTVSNLLVDLVDEMLVPSLSLTNLNFSYSEELWQLLSHFPYILRYRIYSRWKTVHTLRHPLINIRRGKTFGMTRYVVKRLSKETVRMMGRQLGKLCHAHPAVVFDYLLEQIQTFENLIDPVVESIRFLSDLEFDVLSFCIIEHLAAPDKQQLKSSDGTLSPWLQSLATFIGTVFTKYNMELTGVLQYVANQLKNGKSFDLLVLRAVIQNMSGIESTAGLTVDQLEALSGGELLRQEAGSFSLVRSNRRATVRLREALFKENLILGLSILTAQQRQCIVFAESEEVPLKLAGQMLDKCQETFVQFGTFISSFIRNEELCSRIPSVGELISRYHLDVVTAFFIARPTLLPRINGLYDKNRKAVREADGTKSRLDVSRRLAVFKAAFDEVLSEVQSEMVRLLPENAAANVSRVYILFWSLSMYDIYAPKGAYEKELVRVKKSISAVAENTELSKTKRAKEEDQLRTAEKKLSEEQKTQEDHVERVLALLKQDRDTLFADTSQKPRAMMSRFLQYCVLPRAIFTEIDAAYCFRFIITLHQQRTSFFQTVIFFDKLFNDLAIILVALSENEAVCFGRFLALTLETVQRWHSDKQIFDKECAGHPGFLTKVSQRNPTAHDAEKPAEGMHFEAYRTLCHKWQSRMFRSCFAILEGRSYLLLRNCLMVMIKALQYFPLLKQQVANIEKAVITVRDAEKGTRNDLSLLAASYAGHLKSRKVTVFSDDEFHKGSETAPKKVTSVVVKGDSNSSGTSEPSKEGGHQKTAGTVVEERKRNADTVDPPAKKKTRTANGDFTATVAQGKTDEPRRVESRRESSNRDIVKEDPPESRNSKPSDEDTSKRDREKTKHEERKEERKKRDTASTSNSAGKSKSDHAKRQNDRSGKRQGDPTENETTTPKAPRRENGSSEKSPDGKGLKSVDSTASSGRSASKHRHSRDALRADDGSRDRSK